MNETISIIPSSPESERAILGAILQQPDQLAELIGQLVPSDFHLCKHKQIFQGMLALEETGQTINEISLGEWLRNHIDLGASVAELAELSYGLPHFMDLKGFVQLVKDTATKRKLLLYAERLRQMVLDIEEDTPACISFADSALSEIRTCSDSITFRSFSEIAFDAATYYDDLRHGKSRAIPTGFAEWDSLTRGGIQLGDVWVISAMTGKGKTSLALQIARNVALTGTGVGVVSREMTDIENFVRCHIALSSIANWHVRPGLDPHYHDHLSDWLPELAGLPIFVNCKTGNVSELRPLVKNIVRNKRVKLLIVDYLQLLRASVGRSATRAQEVGACSRALKEIALENEIAVLALAQVNREGAHDGKPTLKHIKESGDIEQDASLVGFIDLEGEKDERVKAALLRVEKNRSGPTFDLPFRYIGETFTFESITR